MNKKIILILSAVFIGALTYTAFTYTGVKDNKVYVVKEERDPKYIAKIDSEIKSEGKSSFYEVDSFLNKLDESSILVSVSKSKDKLFYMTPSIAKEKSRKTVLKGKTSININLYMKELSTDKVTEIASNVPFITAVSWSPDGNFATFKGEGHMLLYSLKSNTLLLQNELSKEQIEAASWSADGKKLYLEYTSIPNGGVVYIDSLKLAQSYEIKDENFIKDSLDENKFFAVKQSLNTSSALLSTSSTLIVDDSGKKLTDLSPGIYKDSLKKSVLLKNLNNTYSYIKDFSKSTDASKLTEKIVYDGKFLVDGGLYYITEEESSSNNEFLLHRLDSTGKEISALKISGSSILLLPDGKKGYVNGQALEFINFETNTIVSSTQSNTSADELMLFQDLNGALKNIKDYLLSGESLAASPFFTTSATSVVDKQLGKVNNSVSGTFRDLYISFNPEEKVTLSNLVISGNTKADVDVQITVRTYWLKEFKRNYKLKLVLDKGIWKISEFKY